MRVDTETNRQTNRREERGGERERMPVSIN